MLAAWRTTACASTVVAASQGVQLSADDNQGTAPAQAVMSRKAISDFHKSDAQGAGTRRLVFLTLTLPSQQIHDDKEIKRECLNYFLITLKKYCDIKCWLWVAEAQKNGNIHFHLLVDSYIPFVVINKENQVQYAGDWYRCSKYKGQNINQNLHVQNLSEHIWNNALSKLGYIDTFEAKHKHRNPPTTQIEAMRDPRAAGKYITKYMTKNSKDKQGQSRKISGRLWGCSDELKAFIGVAIPLELEKKVIEKVKKIGKLVVEKPYIKLYIIDIYEISELYLHVLNVYLDIVENIYCRYQT